MADKSPKPSLRHLTRQKFQEEVAWELGVDPNSVKLPDRQAKNLENDLHAEDNSND